MTHEYFRKTVRYLHVVGGALLILCVRKGEDTESGNLKT
ncbi:hypothetical protein BH23DEI1_BH23DEI1_16670 [soil metagenome]